MNSQIPETRSRPSTSRNLEPTTRSQHSTSWVRRPVPLPDFVPPMDAIDDDSLESGDEMLSDESSGSDNDVRAIRRSQSQSRESRNRITGRDDMRHPVDSFNDISSFRPGDINFFGSSTRTFDNPLAKGQVFESKVALRVVMNEFHIRNNYECLVSKSKNKRLTIKCRDNFCKFKLSVKLNGLSGSWIITKQAMPHVCKVQATRADHRQLTTEMIALSIDDAIRKDVCATINHIRDVVKKSKKM